MYKSLLSTVPLTFAIPEKFWSAQCQDTCSYSGKESQCPDHTYTLIIPDNWISAIFHFLFHHINSQLIWHLHHSFKLSNANRTFFPKQLPQHICHGVWEYSVLSNNTYFIHWHAVHNQMILIRCLLMTNVMKMVEENQKHKTLMIKVELTSLIKRINFRDKVKHWPSLWTEPRCLITSISVNTFYTFLCLCMFL